MSDFSISSSHRLHLDHCVATTLDDLGPMGGSLQNWYPLFVENLFKKEEPRLMAVHAALGLAGEAGEVVDPIKKIWAYEQTGEKYRENVGKILEELGDLRFYYTALLNALDVTDDEIISYNVCKLNKRYTKGTFSTEDATNRNDKTDAN